MKKHKTKTGLIIWVNESGIVIIDFGDVKDSNLEDAIKELWEFQC